MTTEFAQELKRKLADLLGGEPVCAYGHGFISTIKVDRGRDRFRLDFFGDVDDDRVLVIRIESNLDRIEKQGAGAGDRGDSRPRVHGRPSLLMRRETDKDRKGKRFGLNRVIQTGDPYFDKLVHVESRAPDEPIQTVLRSQETRHIIKTLLEQHCKSVGINTSHGDLRSELVVNYRTLIPTNEESLPRLAEALHSLFDTVRSLRASLPLFVGDAKVTRRYPLLKGAWWFEALWLVLGMAAGAVTSGLELHPVDDPPLFILLGGGLTAAVLFVPLAFLIARGHPRGAGHFRGLAIVGFISIPFGALGMGITTNCLFDTRPPQTHYVVAVETPEICSWTHPRRDSVAVQDWRDRRRTFNLTLDNMAMCDATKQGDIFMVIVREGFWGWPWLSDMQPVR